MGLWSLLKSSEWQHYFPLRDQLEQTERNHLVDTRQPKPKLAVLQKQAGQSQTWVNDGKVMPSVVQIGECAPADDDDGGKVQWWDAVDRLKQTSNDLQPQLLRRGVVNVQKEVNEVERERWESHLNFGND